MIRAILMLAMLASPAMAGDNNPFSGAREIRVVMVRDHRPAKVRAACSACLRVIRPENARRVGSSSK